MTEIGDLTHAAWTNSEGVKDYLVAVLFGVLGLWLISFFNGWSILGLLLLINPALVFFSKNKYWVFIFLKAGSTVDKGADQKRMFSKEVAKGIAEAVNVAIHLYRKENDPRKGLHFQPSQFRTSKPKERR